MPLNQITPLVGIPLSQIWGPLVLELGSELISSDIIAFYELIKNGIDAGSKCLIQNQLSDFSEL